MSHAHGDASTILSTWSREAAQELEAGRVPLIVLGAGSPGLDALPALSALAGVDDERTGLANPAVLAGGDGGLWLLALMQRPRRVRPQAGGDAARRVQAIQEQVPPALFTGPDPALHAAALNLAAQSVTQTAVVNAGGVGESVPPGLAWTLFPARATGAVNQWAWLPWESLGPPANPDPIPDPSPDPGTAPVAAPAGVLTAYAGLFLALGLLLTALLF